MITAGPDRQATVLTEPLKYVPDTLWNQCTVINQLQARNWPIRAEQQLQSCQTWPPRVDTFPAASVDWYRHLLQVTVCNTQTTHIVHSSYAIHVDHFFRAAAPCSALFRWASVCLSVCLSVKRGHCDKTTASSEKKFNYDEQRTLPLSPQKGLKTAKWPFFAVFRSVSRRKSATKFLCAKTVSGRVVRHSLAYLTMQACTNSWWGTSP